MANFTDKLKETLDDQVSITENGAAGYRTTGKELLDLHFALSSLRNIKDTNIESRFAKVFYLDKLLAVKWLFYVSDVRGGLGERRLFRVALCFLGKSEPTLCKAILPLIPEYTRWDNILCLLDTPLAPDVIALVKKTLNRDKTAMKNGEQVSLCAKWMPSINASSPVARRYAKALADGLGMTAKKYRKTLSALRAYLKLVEVQMSAGSWKTIDYAAVPSRANVIYRDAFLKHDEKRRMKYLTALEKGETKINASVLFPHDIVHSYGEITYGMRTIKPVDPTLEELWKALPDYVNGDDTTICVADGSGSMTITMWGTAVRPLDIANALAIYFSERAKGQFKDKYITFSEHPQLVDFSHCKTLHDKIGVALTHNEVANTDIEAVFDLILTTAVNNKMDQSELPKNILIISDMEFDGSVECASVGHIYGHMAEANRLFDQIAERYAEFGYRLPRLIFWNVDSRTGTIPVKENELGVALVSGFSPIVAQMVLSDKLDPYEVLLEQLNAERYLPVEKAAKKALG